ncbi:hypothetical protein ABW19_dt0210023 [Dactylella cylindrospora]|nr:hypothetical protein ABW19_dt0210023 [Dactylella cylindrospora]
MKLALISLIFVISVATANPVAHFFNGIWFGQCWSNRCLATVRSYPRDSFPFCYSLLNRVVTSTRYRTQYSTTTQFVSTTVSTQTNAAETVTTTVVPVAAGGNKEKRGGGRNPLAHIAWACNYNRYRISSACGCLIGRSVSTKYVVATTTLPYTVTSTQSVTATTNIPTLTVTTTCDPATKTAISNGNFDSAAISPWYITPTSGDATQGVYAIIADPTSPNPSLVLKTTLQVTTRPFSKINIVQDLVTCPGVRYRVAFYYKNEGPFGGSTYIVAFINGGEVYNVNNAPLTWTSGGFQFSAVSGTTQLRLDLVLGSSNGAQSIYIDGFTVAPV